ncbi:hypothetical protein HUK80_06300 [Flavobacterium sp. MAH-1]|uniref:Uncharacterized protein n=1 Tax=Flavobacterium agri TaxID=2743471 RepID=A0A7Y8Y165_9FLAO|nr:hypothetical protein [Flavobacterium agri]NUY80500.1 hypothetical protein [Flavobacterium agri]NYA70525.1 hypothetical protein [Flavobacterium agri]
MTHVNRMHDYTFEHFGQAKTITDGFIDRQIKIAQSSLIQHLDITLDDIGRRTQTANVTYDGKTGTRIEYLVSKHGENLQWLTIFYNTERSFLTITSEIYLGIK